MPRKGNAFAVAALLKLPWGRSMPERLENTIQAEINRLECEIETQKREAKKFMVDETALCRIKSRLSAIHVHLDELHRNLRKVESDV
jgi:hypothetical protein